MFSTFSGIVQCTDRYIVVLVHVQYSMYYYYSSVNNINNFVGVFFVAELRVQQSLLGGKWMALSASSQSNVETGVIR